jgi:TolB-like protein/tetratricopeptide (TPR) repeat protein
MNVLAELKRRHVFRVAALYAAIAWLLIQVTDVVTEPLGLPAWLLKVVIWLLAIGFPVAMVIAWSFELTTQGLKRDTGVELPSVAVSGGRKFDFAIIAALVAALGYFIATRPSNEVSTPLRATPGGPRTLAVLPFANLSSSAEDGFFADGLTEELLNLLADIEGLKVAGRTSSFYFKGRNEDLREIGHKLGVSHILEGSVRRSGQKVRITAQLVSAQGGFHVWSQTYDRELTDVLDIQDEIGRSVADALKVRLAPEAAGRAGRPTVDAEAYRRYLVARSRLQERGLENTQAAVRLFDEAATIDPSFAGAYAGKALALTLLWGNHGVGDTRTTFADAGSAARRALELDPRSSEAEVALGRLAELSWLASGRERRGEAGEHFRRALELDPRSTLALYWLGRYEMQTDPARAIALFEQAIEQDPLEFMAASSRALALLQAGRSGEARAEYERLLGIYPDNAVLLRNYADAELLTGRVDHALELNARASDEGADNWSQWLDARAWWLLGDRTAVRTALMKLDPDDPIQRWQRETGLAMLERDFARTVELSRALTREGGPAIARLAEFTALVRDARDAEALRVAEQIGPEITAADPVVRSAEVCPAADLALVLTRLGEAGRGKRVADTALEVWQRAPGLRLPQDHACRARLLAVAGRREEALTEFERAVSLGFRDFLDWGFVNLIDFDPTLDSLRGEPRFKAQLERIRADLARQRVAAQARLEG